jgi:deoxyribonuclease V
MLKAAVDVFYREQSAKAVCILFNDWTSTGIFSTHRSMVREVAAYEPGAFYKRKLPCILNVLQQVNLSLVDAVVVDGYVYLDEAGKKGLGAHLYEALQRKLPVIGVAKTAFHQNGRQVVSVYRGQSSRPLFVTAAGMNIQEAAAAIQSMAGAYRLPDLLQRLDRMTKEENKTHRD